VTITAAALPDYETRPADATPSTITLQARRFELKRRSILRLAVGGALGLGLATLDLVGRAMPARASNPNPILSVWGDCSPNDYYASSTVCVPTTAWYGNGTPGTCSGTWHRNYSYYGSSVTYDYTLNNTSCAGRNAWKWGGSVRKKCSDGFTYYVDGSTYRNTFSICRTSY